MPTPLRLLMPLSVALVVFVFMAAAQDEGSVRKDVQAFKDVQRLVDEPCATEHSSRWAIKTLADKDAEALVKKEPQDVKIAQLLALEQPKEAHHPRHSPLRLKEENNLYRVKGTLEGYQYEEDQDYHFVLADRDDPKRTLIVESPNPACAEKSGYARQFKAVRKTLFTKIIAKPGLRLKYVRLEPPVPVAIVGPAFYDVVHGKQEGEAKNGMEIHPILSLEVEKP